MNERICTLIQALKIKKIEFARRLNISSPFVSELCSGAKAPSDRTISDICRIFNVNEKWLRQGKGEMFCDTESSVVTRLCAELNAGEMETKILKAYFKIDPEIREQFLEKILREVIAETSLEMSTELSPEPKQEPLQQKGSEYLLLKREAPPSTCPPMPSSGWEQTKVG